MMEMIAYVETNNKTTHSEVDGFHYRVPPSMLIKHSKHSTKHPRDTGYREIVHKKVSKEGVAMAPFGNWMTITPKEVQIIRDMISYIDSKSTLALGLPSNQRYLKEEGKRIAHVHPLCFIWAIIIQPELRNKLRDFRDNSAFALKWSGFLGYSAFHDKGFGKNMEKYYNHRNPEEYLGEFEAFYHSLGLKSEEMHSHAVAKNWEGFASALLNDSSYR
jgi:hypothetical protein